MATTNTAAASARRRRLYLGTAIFCLVSGIIAATLLLAVVYGGDLVRAYAPLIITISAGLVAIIIYALVTVVRAERKEARMARNRLTNRVPVRSCPDYWTLNAATGVCKNVYEPPQRNSADATDPVPTYSIGPTDNTFQPRRGEYALSSVHEMSVNTVCNELNNTMVDVPWTDLRPTCSAYRM